MQSEKNKDGKAIFLAIFEHPLLLTLARVQRKKLNVRNDLCQPSMYTIHIIHASPYNPLGDKCTFALALGNE